MRRPTHRTCCLKKNNFSPSPGGFFQLFLHTCTRFFIHSPLGPDRREPRSALTRRKHPHLPTPSRSRPCVQRGRADQATLWPEGKGLQSEQPRQAQVSLVLPALSPCVRRRTRTRRTSRIRESVDVRVMPRTPRHAPASLLVVQSAAVFQEVWQTIHVHSLRS